MPSLAPAPPRSTCSWRSPACATAGTASTGCTWARPTRSTCGRITTTGATGRRLDADDLRQMVELVVGAVLPGARLRTSPPRHPYTPGGLQVDVCTASGWVELAECGLAAGHVLAGAGLDPGRCTGLALG